MEPLKFISHYLIQIITDWMSFWDQLPVRIVEYFGLATETEINNNLISWGTDIIGKAADED